MGSVFANSPRDHCSIPGRVMPKTQKIVLDTSLFNTQHYKVSIKDKWSNPGKKWYSSLHLSVVANEKGPFGSLSTRVTNFTLIFIIPYYIYIYIYIYLLLIIISYIFIIHDQYIYIYIYIYIYYALLKYVYIMYHYIIFCYLNALIPSATGSLA